jgi:O-methyltransferase
MLTFKVHLVVEGRELFFSKSYYLCKVNQFHKNQQFIMANISLLTIITLVVIMIVLLIIFKYLYNYFVNPNVPLAWAQAINDDRVTKQLRKLKSHYPDKTRFFIWWLQNERLKADKIPGAFAEVGVYKGDSAVILHALDPERELYLFDTFTGFPASDLESETGEAATYTTYNFADTDTEHLLAKFENINKVHLQKGYFPDTTKGLEEKRFALVNLDADLYKPTKAGLEFFYPRLSPGGIIFIHDYNSKWEGIVSAVNEFVQNIPESLVLAPDADGTVVIVRNK